MGVSGMAEKRESGREVDAMTKYVLIVLFSVLSLYGVFILSIFLEHRKGAEDVESRIEEDEEKAEGKGRVGAGSGV